MPAQFKSVGQAPTKLLTKFDRVAHENERSRAAELRIAMKAHIKQHGK